MNILTRIIDSYEANPCPFYIFGTVLLLAVSIAIAIADATGIKAAGAAGK